MFQGGSWYSVSICSTGSDYEYGYRVLRGGCRDCDAKVCRSAFRAPIYYEHCGVNLGFRPSAPVP